MSTPVATDLRKLRHRPEARRHKCASRPSDGRSALRRRLWFV